MDPNFYKRLQTKVAEAEEVVGASEVLSAEPFPSGAVIAIVQRIQDVGTTPRFATVIDTPDKDGVVLRTPLTPWMTMDEIREVAVHALTATKGNQNRLRVATWQHAVRVLAMGVALGVPWEGPAEPVQPEPASGAMEVPSEVQTAVPAAGASA